MGVLWVFEYPKDGEKKKMLSGNINCGILGDVDIAIFRIDNKKEEKHPDYRIVLGNGKSNGKPEEKKEGKPNMF